MSLLSGAIAIISLQKESPVPNSSQVVTASIWLPIGLVALNSVVHTSITTQGRYWLQKSQINSFDQQMDAFLVHTIILALGHFGYNMSSFPVLTFHFCVLVGLGAIFNMLGWLLCSEACVNGIAGPA